MSRRLSISRFSLPPAGDLVDQLSKIEFIEPTGAQQFGLDLRPGEKIPLIEIGRRRRLQRSLGHRGTSCQRPIIAQNRK